MARLGEREGFEVKTDIEKLEWGEQPGTAYEIVFKELRDGKLGGKMLIGWNTETGQLVRVSVPTNLTMQLDMAKPVFGDVLYIKFVDWGTNPATGRKFKKFKVWLYPRYSAEAVEILKDLGLIEELDLSI